MSSSCKQYSKAISNIFPTILIIVGLDETLPKIKHSDISKVNTVNPQKPKINKSVSEIDPCASWSLIHYSSATSSYVMWSKGKYESGA